MKSRSLKVGVSSTCWLQKLQRISEFGCLLADVSHLLIQLKFVEILDVVHGLLAQLISGLIKVHTVHTHLDVLPCFLGVVGLDDFDDLGVRNGLTFFGQFPSLVYHHNN